MIYRSWSSAGGRTLLHVTVAGRAEATIEEETRTAISTAVADIKRFGVNAEHIVRSRIWSRDSTVRQIASDVRRAMLSGALRAASSSYSDEERLPEGSNMMIDLVALCSVSRSASKTVREYEPAIAPPMFIALDGMLFLSGNTDVSPDYATQLATIVDKIGNVLAKAGGSWRKAVAITVYISKRLNPAMARPAIDAHLREVTCPFVMSTVDGFSTPEKLVEIEVTAALG
jgi:enamine deaminase RidA (YjgF/YER057c/UK114 family)